MTAPLQTPSEPRSFQIEKYLPVLAWVVPLVIFLPTLRFEFIYDDIQQILTDPLIRSWHNLPLLVSTDVWRFWNPAVIGNYWRPLFMVWLLVNYKLFGTHPMGWHLTSVVVNAAATYLCYRLVRRLTGSTFIAATGALIFAVHPVHLETVAWISGVTDSLMSVFLLLAFLCFVDGWESESAATYGWFGLSAACFGCSLLFKETAVVLPGLLLAYVLLLDNRKSAQATGRWKAVAAASMYTVVVLLYAWGRHAALKGVDHTAIVISVPTLLLTWPSLLWFYLHHLLWPAGLSIFYDSAPVFHADWKHFWLPLLAIAATVLVVAAVVPRNRRRLAMFAALWMLLPLAPAFLLPSLFPTDYAHDRYLYLSCLGFAMLVALVVERFRGRSAGAIHGWYLPVAEVVMIGVALSVSTSAQMVHWANDLLLYDRATEIAPGDLMGFDGLGRTLLGRGRTREAMQTFRQILRVDPNHWSALYDLGLDDFMNGDYREAEEFLTRAAALKSDNADTSALLAEVLNREGKYSEAEDSIRHAMAVQPAKASYRRVLADSLEGQGKGAEAMKEMEDELRTHPDDEGARIFLKQHRSEKPPEPPGHRGGE